MALGSGDFFTKEQNYTFLGNLGSKAGLQTLFREDSHTAAVIFYTMAAKNKTLSEIEAMSADEKKQLGADFINYLNDHPTKGDNLTKAEIQQNQREYGRMFAKATRKILSEKMPYTQERAETLSSLAMNLGQICDNMALKDVFTEGFGGKKNMDYEFDKLAAAANYLSVLSEAPTSIPAEHNKKVRAAANLFVYEHNKDIIEGFVGKPLNEFAADCLENGRTYFTVREERTIVGNRVVALGLNDEQLNFYLDPNRRQNVSPFSKDTITNIEVDAKASADAAYEGSKVKDVGRRFEDLESEYLIDGGDLNRKFFPNLKPGMYSKDGVAYIGDNDISEPRLYKGKQVVIDGKPQFDVTEGISSYIRKGKWTEADAEFYKDLRQISLVNKDNNGNVTKENYFTQEIESNNMRGLGVFAALVAMHDNPEIHFTDIMGTGFTAQKWEAGREVMDAYKNLATHPERMALLVAKAASAAANINCKKEILHAIGANVNLSGNEAEREMFKPENKMRALAVMSAIGKMSADADALLKNVVPGRDKNHSKTTPFTEPYDDPSATNRGHAKAVYDLAAKDIMDAEAQTKYQGFAVRRERLKDLFGPFEAYGNQFKVKGGAKASVCLTAEKALSVVAQNDSPLWSMDKNQIERIKRTKMALTEAESENSLSNGDKAVREGLSNNDRIVMEHKEETYFKDMDPPKKPNFLIRALNHMGMFKKTMSEYKEADQKYRAKLRDIRNFAAVNSANDAVEAKAANRIRHINAVNNTNQRNIENLMGSNQNVQRNRAQTRRIAPEINKNAELGSNQKQPKYRS